LEQAIVGSPRILGNKVTLLQDGAATYSAMFARDLEVSETIDPESSDRRPLSFRFKEWMARLWARLL